VSSGNAGEQGVLAPGKHPRRDERLISGCFAVTFLAAAGLAVVYWRGGQPQVEGALLAAAGAGLAAGMGAWSHRLLPQGPFVEDRPPLRSPRAQRAEFESDLDRGGVITRRRLITRTLGASVVALGVAFLFPLRSLGPRPSEAELDSTPWRPGTRLVDEDGSPILASDVPFDGLVTVFPDGAVGSETGQAVLVRVQPGLVRPLPGRQSWTPEGFIAYSKVCTHAGCPVGQYEAQFQKLLCPCHESTFDVLDGAAVVFGPAPRPLPQLPLMMDDNGYLRARAGYGEPIGPGFWSRGG
jgi:ubiquinol-cytochrome c reductase iron-sulfur subunit